MKGLVAAKSEIDKSFQMFVIYSEHESYASDFAPIFKSHGLGFLVPGKKQIYVDGESLKDLTYDHLLAIQAHEISHYRLKHKGDYSEKQELEADVEGYKILVDGNYTKAAVILRQRIKDHYGKRGLKMLGENKINNNMKNIKTIEDFLEEKKKKGLWANVHAKRKRGEKPAKPGDEDYPDEEAWKDAQKESVDEGKMPGKFIGNDEIVFLKTKEDSRGAQYNLYYKGYDIDAGGQSFGSEKELKAFASNYILSNQWYNKLKHKDAKPLPESVTEADSDWPLENKKWEKLWNDSQTAPNTNTERKHMRWIVTNAKKYGLDPDRVDKLIGDWDGWAWKRHNGGFEDWMDGKLSESVVTEAASVISMPEAEKVWDALVKKFSDNKNDSIEYLNKDKSYRNMAIMAIFRATKF